MPKRNLSRRMLNLKIIMRLFVIGILVKMKSIECCIRVVNTCWFAIANFDWLCTVARLFKRRGVSPLLICYSICVMIKIKFRVSSVVTLCNQRFQKYSSMSFVSQIAIYSTHPIISQLFWLHYSTLIGIVEHFKCSTSVRITHTLSNFYWTCNSPCVAERQKNIFHYFCPHSSSYSV